MTKPIKKGLKRRKSREMNPNHRPHATFQPNMGFEHILNKLDVAIKIMNSQR